MFKFLKDKLKSALSRFSKGVEEKAEEVKEEKIKRTEEVKEELKKPEQKPEKSFFAKFAEQATTKALSESKFEDLFWDLEVVLMENNVAVEVIEKIKNDLKEKLVDEKIRFGRARDVIGTTLTSSMKELFDVEKIDMVKRIKQKKPYIICFIGVNGSGKTTTIAKFVRMLQKNRLSCVIAAADTFRAASQEQLQLHADKLNVKLIKHDYNADPAAVAYDAIEHAKAAKKDVVLIDTAGRSHANTNLMDELKKVVKVAKPDLKVFVGDSLTGNDAIEQAKSFNEAVGIDAIVLSKVDVDEKGGAAISMSYVTKKPIIYIGTGQEYDDLNDFSADAVIKSLGLES